MRKINNNYIKDLIKELDNKRNIKFSFDNDTTNVIINETGDTIEKRLENVVFEKNNKKYKIYEGLFFREFGPPTNDKDFYNYQKMLILNFFK